MFIKVNIGLLFGFMVCFILSIELYLLFIKIMTKNECILLITCVEHRLRYLHKALNGNLIAESRQSKNDELHELLPLESKLKQFLTKFSESKTPY